MDARKFLGRVVGAAAVVVGAFAATAAPAQAAAPAASSVGALTVVTSGTTTAVPTVTAAKESCWYHHSVQSGVLKGGTKLWVLEQIVNWCGTGKKVTKVTSNRNYFSHLAGGVSVEKGPTARLTTIDANHRIDRTEATVKFCILKVGCLATYHPWIEANIYGNGTRNSNGGF